MQNKLFQNGVTGAYVMWVCGINGFCFFWKISRISKVYSRSGACPVFFSRSGLVFFQKVF